jgi:hypothetical protein
MKQFLGDVGVSESVLLYLTPLPIALPLRINGERYVCRYSGKKQ